MYGYLYIGIFQARIGLAFACNEGTQLKDQLYHSMAEFSLQGLAQVRPFTRFGSTFLGFGVGFRA